MATGQKMVSVGKGQIDWTRIFSEHDEAGIQHYFVEHDEPADPMASITESYRYLRDLRF
jgi:sugar phosphate isomerase/epimerase